MIYRVGEVEIDEGRREVRRSGVAQDSEPKVFEFLLYLIRFRERLVTKEELLDQLWEGRHVCEAVLTRAAHAARRILADPGAIKTLYGQGYRFVAPVAVSSHGLAPGAMALNSGPAESLNRGAGHRVLIGRRSEVVLVSECLEAVVRGGPRALLVIGDAGIGKTAISEQVALSARALGAHASWGKCSEVPGAPPYWPFIQLLREVVAGLPQAPAGQLLEQHAELTELMSSLPPAQRAGPGDPEQARFRLFDVLTRFLREASRVQPLALLLDDLHCADTPSLHMFQFLVRHLLDARVLVVAAYRDAEMRSVPGRARLIRDVARLPGVQVMGLTGLDRAEVAEFVGWSTGGTPSQSELDFLLAQTAGNPFYLSQLAPLLAGSGRVTLPSGHIGGVPLPRSVMEAIECHLGFLSPHARRLLEVAAVVGREFDLGLVARVLGEERSQALELLEGPLDAALLTEAASPGTFRFAHVLIRDVLYAALSPSARTDLHLRIGKALEHETRAETDSVVSALAHHFTEASPTTSSEKAIGYRVLAGDLAATRLAHEEAAHQLTLALGLLDATPRLDDGQCCDVLLKLGTAQTRSGDRDAARETFRRAANLARSIRATERLARVALDLAPGFFSIETGVVDTYLIERLEEALLELGDAEPLLRSRLLSRLVMALCWTDQVERRGALCEELAALASTTRAPEVRLDELKALHAVTWSPDLLAERLEWSAEAIRLSERLGDLDAELVSRCFRIVDSLQLGDIHAVRAETATFKKVAVAAHQPECLWMSEMYDAMFALVRGDYAEVTRFGMQSLALGERLRHHNAYQSGGLYLSLAAIETGRAAEVLPGLTSYASLYPNVPWGPLLALGHLRAGNLPEARRHFDSGVPATLGASRDNVWLPVMAWLCEVAAFINAEGPAVRLHAALRPYSGLHAAIGYGAATCGAVDRYIGLLSLTLGRWTDAVVQLEAGIEQNSKLGAEAFVAHGRRELAVALLGRGAPGDREQAGRLLDESGRTAQRLGMVWLIDQVRSMLA